MNKYNNMFKHDLRMWAFGITIEVESMGNIFLQVISFLKDNCLAKLLFIQNSLAKYTSQLSLNRYGALPDRTSLPLIRGG